ncbi:MAG: glycosyltransferase family 9 protein [Deltaproteobacteria bacterium]|nr:glycosyltransferase family 9 protein [Deltaproteobacteria bacterium]
MTETSHAGGRGGGKGTSAADAPGTVAVASGVPDAGAAGAGTGAAGAGAGAAGRVPWPSPAVPFPAWRDLRSILVVKTSALGDIIHALPTLYALRSLFPEARLCWAAEPRFAGILPGPPWIDSVVPYRKDELRALPFWKIPGALRGMARGMRASRFDLALDLQGLMKSTLVCLLSGARKRLGYCEMREGSFLFTRPVKGPNRAGHVIERYLDVARSLGPVPDEVRFPLPDCSGERDAFRRELLGLGLSGPLALIFPGAGWASKLWPPASYARLAARLSAAGMAVALGGGPGDADLASEIISLAKAPLPDLCGRTDIRGLMGLTSLASLCVGADTGPLHLAAAQGTPTVSLFGPSSGRRAGTWGLSARYVQTDAPCSPCFKRRCPKKEFVCMGRIDPEAVFRAALEVLPLGPPRALEDG